MALGFTCLGVIGFIISSALILPKTVFPLFIVLYGIFNAIGKMGPGVATFLCVSERFRHLSGATPSNCQQR